MKAARKGPESSSSDQSLDSPSDDGREAAQLRQSPYCSPIAQALQMGAGGGAELCVGNAAPGSKPLAKRCLLSQPWHQPPVIVAHQSHGPAPSKPECRRKTSAPASIAPCRPARRLSRQAGSQQRIAPGPGKKAREGARREGRADPTSKEGLRTEPEAKSERGQTWHDRTTLPGGAGPWCMALCSEMLQVAKSALSQLVTEDLPPRRSGRPRPSSQARRGAQQGKRVWRRPSCGDRASWRRWPGSGVAVIYRGAALFTVAARGGAHVMGRGQVAAIDPIGADAVEPTVVRRSIRKGAG